MFDSAQDVDILDIILMDLLEDLYEYSLWYFDKYLSLLVKVSRWWWSIWYGDYNEYDNSIKEKTRLLWPGFDIEICEYLYD